MTLDPIMRVDPKFRDMIREHIIPDARSRRKLKKDYPGLPIFKSFTHATREIAKDPDIFTKLFKRSR